MPNARREDIRDDKFGSLVDVRIIVVMFLRLNFGCFNGSKAAAGNHLWVLQATSSLDLISTRSVACLPWTDRVHVRVANIHETDRLRLFPDPIFRIIEHFAVRVGHDDVHTEWFHDCLCEICRGPNGKETVATQSCAGVRHHCKTSGPPTSGNTHLRRAKHVGATLTYTRHLHLHSARLTRNIELREYPWQIASARMVPTDYV